MAKGGMEVVLVQKSGPVRSMCFKAWWIYFFAGLMIVFLGGLIGCGILLYQQYEKSAQLAKENHNLLVRLEKLEKPAKTANIRNAPIKQNKNPKAPTPAPNSKPDHSKTQKDGAKAPAKTSQSKSVAAAAQSGQDGSASIGGLTPEDEPHDGILQAEPKKSSQIEIRKLTKKSSKGRLRIKCEVANLHKANDPAVGYATVIMRGKRAGKTWIESYPRMKLSLLGRPVNFRRGIPFSIKRYRTIEAKFQVKGKKFDRIEIVVYSKDGNLILAHFHSM